jgi:hypothetical protein
VNVGDVSPSVPVTVCGNAVGVLGDASASCGTNPDATDTTTDIDLDIGTSGTGTDPGTGTTTGIDTGIGVDIGVSTGDRHQHRGDHRPAAGDHLAGRDRRRGPRLVDRDLGHPGTLGLTPGSGGADGSATSFAPLRPSVAGSSALPFTGAASDLLAFVAFGLLVAGALVARATPARRRNGRR